MYQSMLYYDKLRYRLMPYIYSIAGQTFHNNYTIMRGLVMDFQADKAVANIGDQFMFGPAILVSPVTELRAVSRKLYLPATTGWYNFYTGKYSEGGQSVLADAPLEKIPLFVKEGSIIPFGPQLQYTNEKNADTVTLFVYTGKDASFSLYEDENNNYNYEKGQFATIDFSWAENTTTLTIGKRNGNFTGMLKERYFKVVLIGKGQEKGYDLNRKPDKIKKYNGEKIIMKF